MAVMTPEQETDWLEAYRAKRREERAQWLRLRIRIVASDGRPTNMEPPKPRRRAL
jgi:hypothetical protein